MSNIGKSHWARRMAASGSYHHIDCDARVIETLPLPSGSPLSAFAEWLGQPWEDGYTERSADYLACEYSVMRETLGSLSDDDTPRVIDTSGCVIYLPEDVLIELKQRTRIIYLEAPADYVAHLWAQYKAHPKPLIWHGVFQPQAGEAMEVAAERCYPLLVQERTALYEQWADVRIPYTQHSQDQTWLSQWRPAPC